MQAALAAVWPWVEELAASPRVHDDVERVLRDAGLRRPEVPAAASVAGRTGRDGVHTEALSYLLGELQSVARAHPGATW
jgi:ring-1,2-phenylacetyl-CoA epoxidase subunit PaaC